MIYNITTISISIITLLLLVIFRNKINYWVKKKGLLFWFAAFCIAFFLAERTIPTIVDIAIDRPIRQLVPVPGTIPYTDPDKWEALLLTNLCPFLMVFLSLLILFRRERLASMVAPWGAMSGFITLVGTSFSSSPLDWGIFHAFFIGYSDSRGFWLLHFLLFVMCIMLTLSYKNPVSKALFVNLIFMGSFLLYVYLIMSITGIRSSVTGISYLDWTENGLYAIFYSLFKQNAQITRIIGYSFFTLFNLIFLSTQFIGQEKYKWETIDQEHSIVSIFPKDLEEIKSFSRQ